MYIPELIVCFKKSGSIIIILLSTLHHVPVLETWSGMSRIKLGLLTAFKFYDIPFISSLICSCVQADWQALWVGAS